MAHPATLTAVQTYIRVLGAPGYTVGVVPNKGDDRPALRREWLPDVLVKSVNWLAAQNSADLNIFARPNGTRFALIDDIEPPDIERLRADGLPPRLVLETSPKNYAVWLDLEPGLTRDESTAAGRLLAERYNGDPASIDWNHYSRLPGFTNRKPARRTNGQPPFVKIVSTSVEPAPAAAEFRREAQAAAAVAAGEKAAAVAAVAELTHSTTRRDLDDSPAALYMRFGARARTEGKSESQIDFHVCLRAVSAGYTAMAIEEILRGGSDLYARKAAHVSPAKREARVQGYIDMTIANAVTVVEQRKTG